jgi:hypothetical protein
MKYLSVHPRPTSARLPPGERIPATIAWLGTFGAGLTVAGVQYPGRTLFTLMFLAVTPAVCFAQLVRGIDPVARAVVSIAAGITLVGLVAEVMLTAEWWTPRGGLVAVGVLCLVMLGLALTRRPSAPRRPKPPPGPPPEPAVAVSEKPRPAPLVDEDDWIYEP